MTTRRPPHPGNPFLKTMEPAPRDDGFAGLTDAERDHAQAGVEEYQHKIGIAPPAAPPSTASKTAQGKTGRAAYQRPAANDDPEVPL